MVEWGREGTCRNANLPLEFGSQDKTEHDCFRVSFFEFCLAWSVDRLIVSIICLYFPFGVVVLHRYEYQEKCWKARNQWITESSMVALLEKEENLLTKSG